MCGVSMCRVPCAVCCVPCAVSVWMLTGVLACLQSACNPIRLFRPDICVADRQHLRLAGPTQQGGARQGTVVGLGQVQDL